MNQMAIKPIETNASSSVFTKSRNLETRSPQFSAKKTQKKLAGQILHNLQISIRKSGTAAPDPEKGANLLQRLRSDKNTALHHAKLYLQRGGEKRFSPRVERRPIERPFSANHLELETTRKIRDIGGTDQNIEQYDSKPNHLPLSSCAQSMYKFSSLRTSFTAGNSPKPREESKEKEKVKEADLLELPMPRKVYLGKDIGQKILESRAQSKSYHNPGETRGITERSEKKEARGREDDINTKPQTARAKSYRRSQSRTKVIGLDTPTPAPQSREPNITFDMRSSQTGTLSAKNEALLSQLSPSFNLKDVSRMTSFRGRTHLLFSGKGKIAFDRQSSSHLTLSPFSGGSEKQGGGINKIDPFKANEKKPDFQSSPSSHMKTYFQAKEPNQTHKKPEIKEFQIEREESTGSRLANSAFCTSPQMDRTPPVIKRKKDQPFDTFLDLRAFHNKVALKSPHNLSKSDAVPQTSRLSTTRISTSRANLEKPDSFYALVKLEKKTKPFEPQPRQKVQLAKPSQPYSSSSLRASLSSIQKVHIHSSLPTTPLNPLQPFSNFFSRLGSQEKALNQSLRLKSDTEGSQIPTATFSSSSRKKGRYPGVALNLLYKFLSLTQLLRLAGTGRHFYESTRKTRLKRFLEFLIYSPNGALSDEARVAYWLRKAEVQKSMRRNPQTYSSLLFARDDLDIEAQTAIERDLERTFPHNAYFQQGNEGYGKMQRVLLAFALFNPRIGYTQGMNFVCGNFLLLLEEEQCFWMMNNFLHKFKLLDLFTEGMFRLKVALYQLSCLTQIYLPQVYIHLRNLGLSVSTFAPQWFLTLFSYDIQERGVLYRIWNLFMLKKWKVLIRVALGVLKLCEEDIVHSQHDQCLMRLKHFGEEKEQFLNELLPKGYAFKVTNRMLQQLEDCYKLSQEAKVQPPELLALNGRKLVVLPTPPDQIQRSARRGRPFRPMSSAMSDEGARYDTMSDEEVRESVCPQLSLEEYLDKLRRKLRRKHGTRTSSAHPEQIRKSEAGIDFTPCTFRKLRKSDKKENDLVQFQSVGSTLQFMTDVSITSSSMDENLSESQAEIRPRESREFLTQNSSPHGEIENKPSLLNFHRVLSNPTYKKVKPRGHRRKKSSPVQCLLQPSPSDKENPVRKPRKSSKHSALRATPSSPHILKEKNISNLLAEAASCDDEMFHQQRIFASFGADSSMQECDVADEECGFYEYRGGSSVKEDLRSFSEQSGGSSVLGVTNRLDAKNQRQSCPLQRHQGDADLDDELLLSSYQLLADLDDTQQNDILGNSTLSQGVATLREAIEHGREGNGILSTKIAHFPNPLSSGSKLLSQQTKS